MHHRYLKRGFICYFRYNRYHRDPYPMALILYADDKILHCLNIHYLSKDLTQELVEIITDVALKKLDAKNAYRFYHNTLKIKLPHVIQRCYRVYKTQHIQHVVVVSNGFETSKKFIETLRQINIPKTLEEQVKHRIQKQIDRVKNTKKSPKELMSAMSSLQIADDIDEYFSKIKSITKSKVDLKKYTRLR
jgi:methyl coenzyme M reductase subunit C-like uncharacterized protein (methanogenesis marker protein 7)